MLANGIGLYEVCGAKQSKIWANEMSQIYHVTRTPKGSERLKEAESHEQTPHPLFYILSLALTSLFLL